MRTTKQQQKKIAKEHIETLFKQAKEIFKEDPKLSDRYVKMALRVRDKIKVRLTKEQKALFCKECHSFLMPGKNCIIRTKNKMMLYHCQKCKGIRRFVIRTKK